jgi:hypothetical protein
MFQSECSGCGLSVHDLPDELGDRPDPEETTHG